MLIAGGPGASHTYMHGFSPLARHHRLIYFDALGCGKSESAQRRDEYSLDRAVRDVEALRAALGLQRWSVLGHSYGGVVAQAYALEHQDAIQHLVLANTLVSGEAWQAALDYANEQLRNQYPEIWEQIQALRSRGLRSSAPEHQKLYEVSSALLYFFDAANEAKTVFEIAPEAYFGIAGEDADFHLGLDMLAVDFRPRLSELRIPTLVLAGRFDRIVFPRCTLPYKSCAPKARFVMFEKSGHLPFVEQPEETFLLLREFLGG